MTDLAEMMNQGAFGLMLVVARVAGAIMLLPGMGESAPPAMLRAGLALCIALLLLPGLLPILPPPPEAGIQAALMIGAEVLTGVWFGWLARLVALALPVAAQFIAYLLGLSSVLQADAELGPQSTALSRLFDLAAPLAVLSSDLYQLPLLALGGLYTLVPAGALLPSTDGALTVLEMMTQTFAAGRTSWMKPRKPRAIPASAPACARSASSAPAGACWPRSRTQRS